MVYRQALQQIFRNNRAWAASIKEKDKGFFERLSAQQTPNYLWIGCSDSRVPANQLMGLQPGEVFVHRNIANNVHHTDLNVLSVLQYSVQYLKVQEIIVCGHYLCGGVRAALDSKEFGLIDNWLRGMKDLYMNYKDEIDALPTEDQRVDKLCELNVINQVNNVARTTIVQNAWKNGQKLAVHGLIYDIRDGLLRNLNVSVASMEHLPQIYRIEKQTSTTVGKVQVQLSNDRKR